MDENTRRELTVDGYQFGSKDDAALASQELKTIGYIDKKIENRSAETILSVYQGALDKKMFRTPIGYAYLHDLRRRMQEGGLAIDDLQGVPLYQIFDNHVEDSPRPDRTIKVNTRKKRDALKSKNRTLTIVNFVLIVLIIALFAISFTGSTPTVLNYRNAIQNEYSGWEQELKDREAVIRQKERELNINEY